MYGEVFFGVKANSRTRGISALRGSNMGSIERRSCIDWADGISSARIHSSRFDPVDRFCRVELYDA